MLKLLKRAALLAVALPAVASAQATIFNALGGPVTVQIGFGGTTAPGVFIPFQLFLEAVGGNPRRELFNETGTTFSLNGGAFTPNGSPVTVPLLSLGSFAPGADLIFSYVVDGNTYNHVGQFTDLGTSYFAQYFTSTLSSTNGTALLTVTNIQSLENANCLTLGPPGSCVDTPADFPTTGAPEPGTIFLMGTGLAALVPVVRRKRRTA